MSLQPKKKKLSKKDKRIIAALNKLKLKQIEGPPARFRYEL